MNNLKMSTNNEKRKPISDSCNEVIGFLFRELLNHIIETSLEINKHNSITSNDIYEYCRLHLTSSENNSNLNGLLVNVNNLNNNQQIGISNFKRKKYSFF
jgi:hypothetical protein